MALALPLMLLLPGWAFLSVTRLWKSWPVLQRWILAFALSVAFYPVLFYGARQLIPGLQLGQNKILALWIIFAILIIFGLRRNWKEQFAFDHFEWLALGVFAFTLYTRIAFIQNYPYPTWTDSLHHTLLTQLTASSGQLPMTLEPYFPVPMNMYHLGLYSLTGVLQLTSGTTADQALLWTMAVFNGLCGAGIYFAIDRLANRKAAIVGAVVVGLLSMQPAWYANWGRDTQLASQTILLPVWLFSWHTLQAWADHNRRPRLELTGLTAGAALLNAGVFLLHFRVAGLYLPLLVITALWEWVDSFKKKTARRFFLGVFAIGAFSLLLCSPALGSAAQTWWAQRSGVNLDLGSDSVKEYYQYPWEAISWIGLQPAIVYVSGFLLAAGMLLRSKFTWITALWFAGLYALGQAYQTGISLLAITNMGAVIIMLYLPAGMAIGAGMDAIGRRIGDKYLPIFQNTFLAVALLLGLMGGYERITGVDPSRQFIQPGDPNAMAWIKANIPADAAFAINTNMWLGTSPQGSDGGYWIPYFTGRKTNTGIMLNSLGSKDYFNGLITASKAVLEIQSAPSNALQTLCSLNFRYIYVSGHSGPDETNLNPDLLQKLQELEQVYAQQGVSIFKISRCP